MNPDIIGQSQNVPVRVALPVLDYGRSHRQRREVASGAGTRTGGRLPLDG